MITKEFQIQIGERGTLSCDWVYQLDPAIPPIDHGLEYRLVPTEDPPGISLEKGNTADTCRIVGLSVCRIKVEYWGSFGPVGRAPKQHFADAWFTVMNVANSGVPRYTPDSPAAALPD